MPRIAKKEKTCLLMFSGGYDTLLAPCYLVERGYKVVLVTYDNGMEINLKAAEENAKRLMTLYGSKIEFAGCKSIVSIWRELFLIPYLLGRKKFEYKLVPMEMFCLSCRTSMYIRSIAECRLNRIGYIAEGARESQKYPEQQSPVVKVFQKLCKNNSIELILPVYDVKGKEEIKEELIRRNIVPKTTEPYCTFAVPVYEYAPLEQRVEEMRKFMTKYLMPKAQEIIDKLPNVVKVRSTEDLV